MRLRNVSHALKAVADVAHAGEEFASSIDRTRSRGSLGTLILGIGLGVGIGVLLFSEKARQQVQTFLVGERGAAHANGGAPVAPAVGATEVPRGEAAPQPQAPPPH